MKTMTLFWPPDRNLESKEPLKLDVDEPAKLNEYLTAISQQQYTIGRESMLTWANEAMDVLNKIQMTNSSLMIHWKIDELRLELKRVTSGSVAKLVDAPLSGHV